MFCETSSGQSLRLSEEHLKALFTAARVELLGDENHYTDPATGHQLTGVDTWVAAFQEKIREIDNKRRRFCLLEPRVERGACPQAEP